MHFPVFLKTGLVLHGSLLSVEQLIFSKLLCEIEAAAICFVMERGRRKSQQNCRIRVRAEKNWFIQYETCLTHQNHMMLGKSKEFENVGGVASSFPTYLGRIEVTLLAGYS